MYINVERSGLKAIFIQVRMNEKSLKKSGIGFRTSNMADGWEVAKLDGNVLYKKGAFKDASSCSCSCSCSCPHRDGGTHVGS